MKQNPAIDLAQEIYGWLHQNLLKGPLHLSLGQEEDALCHRGEAFKSFSSVFVKYFRKQGNYKQVYINFLPPISEINP